MDYDLSRLTALGRKRKRLLDQLDALRREMAPEIQAARSGGVKQKTVEEVSHYTRDMIRQMCLPPEKREAEAKRRRARTRKAT